MITAAIADYVKQNGIKQSILCRRTGLTKYLVRQSLHGKRRLSIEEYIKICSALNVPYTFFFEQRRKTWKETRERVAL